MRHMHRVMKFVATAVMAFAMKHLSAGRHIYAVGSDDPTCSHYVGVTSCTGTSRHRLHYVRMEPILSGFAARR